MYKSLTASRYIATAAFIATLMVFAAVMETPAAPNKIASPYNHAKTAAPGEVVAVTAATSKRFTVELHAPSGGTVAEAQAFLYASEAEEGHAVALLGLSAKLDPGEYLLKVFDAEGEEERYMGALQVTSRDFRKETIALKPSMSSLRREPDERKRREAKEIQQLYAKFDPGHTYDAQLYQTPVEWRRISSHYGDRRVYEYDNGGTARTIHTGVDFAADIGTPVRACAQGKVVMAKERVISGYSVVVAHLPGVYSIYFHLDSLDVKVGEYVARADTLGTVGKTGLATGPHLHWEVRINGVPVNPRELTKTGITGIIENAGAETAP